LFLPVGAPRDWQEQTRHRARGRRPHGPVRHSHL